MYVTKPVSYTLLLLSFSLLISCGTDDEGINPETGIVGSWRLASGEYTFNNLSARDYYRQIFDQAGISYDDSDLDQAANLLEQALEGDFDNGTVFEFQESGDFISRGPNGTNTATWDITNIDQLIVTDATSSLNFTISSLSDSELRLLFENQNTVDFSNIGLSNAESITIGITLIFNKQ